MRALLSAADPDGIADLARALVAHGATVHVTAPACDALRAEGIDVRPATDLTGGDPLPDDGVDPRIAAAIAVRRDHPDALAALAAAGATPIDLVVVALRPLAPAGAPEPMFTINTQRIFPSCGWASGKRSGHSQMPLVEPAGPNSLSCVQVLRLVDP